jgi:hypothetical protein
MLSGKLCTGLILENSAKKTRSHLTVNTLRCVCSWLLTSPLKNEVDLIKIRAQFLTVGENWLSL